MCFPRCKSTVPNPKYDEEGTILHETNSETYIPEAINEHVDSIYVNTTIEHGVYAFIYETSYEYVVVWTSIHAQMIVEICDELGIDI